MKIEIDLNNTLAPNLGACVGNVYQVRGGIGARAGHMHLIVAIYDGLQPWHGSGVATLTINKQGQIVGANSYSLSYFDDKMPIAFCEGVENVNLLIRSL